MSIPVIDLFAGAGGLGLGAIQAGADVRLSVELDKNACETLRLNHSGHEVLQADVATLTGKALRAAARLSKSDPLIVVGGAPCQPFSKAAYWVDPGEEAEFRRARSRGEIVERPSVILEARPDERRDLIFEFWRLIEESKADGFVFENVTSILHPRNRHLVIEFVRLADNAGYGTVQFKANAIQYGVAQKRERILILGLRKGQPRIPQATHALEDERSLYLKPTVTAGDAIAQFDKQSYFEPEELVFGRWAKELAEVPPGWNYKALTAWAGHSNPTFIAESRFWNFLLKLTPDRPSWTLAATPGPWTGPFHWSSRRLRTPELAALQGFPETYRFAGSRRERVRQIGNAVPPPLAMAAVKTLVNILESGRAQKAA